MTEVRPPVQADNAAGSHEDGRQPRDQRPHRTYEVWATPGRVGVRVRHVDVVTETSAGRLRRSLWRGGRGTGGQRINAFSDASRERMRRFFLDVDWAALGTDYVHVTLTYWKDWPTDGRVLKETLDALWNRWRRKWGQPMAVWVLEFQERGAPHFHLYAVRPPGAERDQLVTWMRAAWHDLGRRRGFSVHPERGAHVLFWSFPVEWLERMRSTLGDYFWRHNGKEGYQKEVPDGFENIGRFWDVVGIKKTEFRTSVERAEYVEGRRVVRSLRTRVTRVSKTGTAMVQEAGCDHERSVRAERGQRCAGGATGAVDA